VVNRTGASLPARAGVAGGRGDALDPSPLVSLALTAYLAYGLRSDRFLEFQKEFFGLVVLLLGAVAVVGLLTRRQALGRYLRLLAVLTLYALFALPILIQPAIYPRWLLGDLAIVAAPFLFALAGQFYPAFYGARQVTFVLLVMFGTALAASLFPDAGDANRFEPPMVLLMAAAWWRLAQARGLAVVAWLALLAGLLVLAWFSAVRNAPVVWLLLGILALAGGRRGVSLPVVALLTLGLALLALSQEATLDLLARSRFGRISLDNLLTEGFVYLRLAELRDVWATFWSSSNVLQRVLGFGYGATYNMNELYTALTLDALDKGRLSAEGLAHVIHFGPMRILFRYGLLGLLVVLWLLTMIVRDALALARGDFATADWRLPVFVLAVYAYGFRFLLHPVGNELSFAYTLGGYLALRGAFRHDAP